MLPGIKGSSKLPYLVANIGWPFDSLLTTHCQIYDQTKFHMVKGIDNAFDHIELCFVLLSRIILVKICLFFREITFITEFPDSNFLLPRFLTGGKWDFQVANLLLATVNFNPARIIPTSSLISLALFVLTKNNEESIW